MSLSKPKVIGVGTTCYVTTTDNITVLKGYQVWFDGNLIYGAKCATLPLPCEPGDYFTIKSKWYGFCQSQMNFMAA